ncbi:MAG: flagellar basal body-associated FliL family protein [Bdellovibrionota bacterium]
MADEENNNEEAEGSKEANADETSVAKKGKGMLLMIIGGVLFLVLSIGAPLLYVSMKPKTKKNHVAHDAAKTEHDFVLEGYEEEYDLDEDEEALGAIYPLETFIVNLANEKYIRLQVQLEFTTRDIPRRFYSTLVPVRDGLITLLNSRTVEDLSGSTAKDNLKQDIKNVVNETMRREMIKNVYFTQFVIQ